MSFPSVLFAGAPGASGPPTISPTCLTDLNLDQIFAGVTAGREARHLRDDLSAAPSDEDIILDRQQVFRDVARGTLRESLDRFAGRMDRVRRDLAQAADLSHRYQRGRWHADAATEYRSAVVDLRTELSAARPRSRGLQAVAVMLDQLTAGTPFQDMCTDLELVMRALRSVRYELFISGGQVQVSRGGGNPDYAQAVRATFERFRQGEVRNHLVNFPDHPAMNHVEAGVLDLVAELYPEAFAELDRFCRLHPHIVDAEVAGFDRDIQFFLGYLDYIAPMVRAGLPFCFPTFDRPAAMANRSVDAVDTFDLALAAKLCRAGAAPPVRNDVTLTGHERILVVTGPNNGGKTTFARTVGQLHHLARLGLPVPGASARLLLCDTIFTHFARAETTGSAHGKLQDELVRVHDILRQASTESIVILNELFTSTTLSDAILLGHRIMRSLVERDLVAVYVTFIDELADHADTVVSMVATVPDDDLTARTFRIVRRPADGTAHAHALAVRHRLTYEHLTQRIAS